MSEIALKIAGDGPTEPREPRPALTGRWLPVQLAAERAGCNVGALRRRIVEQGWVAEGLARQVKQASGQLAYEVDEGADPRFAVNKAAQTLTDAYRASREFLGLPQAIRDRALQRESIVQQWQQRVAAGRTLRLTELDVTGRFVTELAARGVEVTRASLYNWRKALRTSGLAGLVDEWGKRVGRDTTRFWELASELWLHPNKRSAAACWDRAKEVAEANGWELMSERDFRRKLSRIPKGVVIKRRDGEDAFVARAEPSIQRDYTTISANDWWVSDNHTLDVMVRVGTHEDGRPIIRRPYIHVWQDVRSRKILGWSMHADAPRASDVLACVTRTIREHGKPGMVYVDNGGEYDARKLQGVTKHQRLRGKRPDLLTPAEIKRVGGAFNVWGIPVTHARPHHGQSKPVERQFGTLCGRFAKWFEAYTGPSTTDKPDKGRGTTATKRAIERGDVLTIEEMREEFGRWLADDYNGKAGHGGHAMDGRSPDACYLDELPASIERIADELLDFGGFETVGPVTIHKNGVTWRGVQFGQFADSVIRLLGQKVLLKIDQRAATHVYLLGLDGGLICRAEANVRLPWGADQQTLDDAHKLKRKARDAVKAYRKERPRLSMGIAEIAHVADRRRKARQDTSTPRTDNPPPSVRPAATAFDGQSAAIRSALEQPKPLRLAAGGEDMTERFRYTRPAGGELVDMTTGEVIETAERFGRYTRNPRTEDDR